MALETKCPMCNERMPDVGMTYCYQCGAGRGRAKLQPRYRRRETKRRKSIRLPGFQEGELRR